MNLTEGERLMRLETKIDEQAETNLRRFDSIETKLDRVIDGKADKKDVEDINNRFWALLAGMVLAAMGAIITWMKK